MKGCIATSVNRTRTSTYNSRIVFQELEGWNPEPLDQGSESGDLKMGHYLSIDTYFSPNLAQ